MVPLARRGKIGLDWRAARPESIEHFHGRAWGFFADFTMTGGTAPTSTALAHPAGTVPGNVARGFAATGRMPDMNRISQIRVFRKLRDIRCIRVHFMPLRGLRRATAGRGRSRAMTR